jgi:hypothetical protein
MVLTVDMEEVMVMLVATVMVVVITNIIKLVSFVTLTCII